MKKAEKYFRIGVEKESGVSKKKIDRIVGRDNNRIIVYLACTKNQGSESVQTLEILPDKLSDKTKLEWT